MAVNINASTSSGIGITSDNSGVIQFQSNGANTVNVAANGTLTASNVTTTGLVTAGNVTISSGGSITFPDATTQNTAGISASMTLLGTLITTANNSVSLGSLTLTSYKYLYIVINGVGHSGAGAGIVYITPDNTQAGVNFTLNTSTSNYYGTFLLDLTTGQQVNTLTATAAGSVSTATTTLYFRLDGTKTFDAGSLVIYGVK